MTARSTRTGSAICLVATALVAACGGGGGASGDAPQGSVAVDADLEIAKAVYGVSATLPPGFHAEPERYPDRQTFKVHVRQGDLAQPKPDPDFEVCSDDFDEALSFSKRNADALGYVTTLSGTDDNDWFFQFDRAIESAEPAMLVNRVFKCAGVDRSVQNGSVVAELNRRPVEAGHVRFLAEYLWHFSTHNNALNAVLSSSSASAELEHRLRRAEALRFGGKDGCDRIEVWDQLYVATPSTGIVERTDQFVRAFDARFDSGSVTLCGA